MVIVIVRTCAGDTEQISESNFRSWKRRSGKHAAFVVLTPEHGEQLVTTYTELLALPEGEFDADLVQKCRPPEAVRKELRGTDLWKRV